MRPFWLACALLAATVLLSACSNPNPALNPQPDVATFELMPVEEGPSAVAIEPELAKRIATLELDGGASLTFLDVGQGHVGIAERRSRGTRFVATAMMTEWHATPLEIYLALKPASAKVPALLVKDHARQKAHLGNKARPPRALSMPLTSQGLRDRGLEAYPCDAFGWDWRNDWENAFSGVTDYYPAGYLHQYPYTYTFYPGAHIYKGTNTNQVTYLGACNGDATDSLVMEVHRKVKHYKFHPYPQPPTFTWVWKKVQEVTINGYEKYTFYANLPGSFRGRTYGEGDSTVGHYGIGAAYTKTPPIGLTP